MIQIKPSISPGAMPALNVTREEISLMIDCLDAILVKAGAARRVA